MKTIVLTLEYPPTIGGIASYVQNFMLHVPPEQYVVLAPKRAGDTAFDATNPWRVYRRAPYFSLVWPRWLRLLWHTYAIAKKEKAERLFIHHVLPAGTVGLLLKKLGVIRSYSIFLHGADTLLLRASFKRSLFRAIISHADCVYVNSSFLKTTLEARFDILPSIVELNPAPADAFFARPDLPMVEALKQKLALSGKKVLLSVGRLSEGKGFPYIIHVLPEIVKQVPNLVWMVIGEGPKQAEITTLIQKYQLQNVVRLLGRVPLSELPTYYHAADVFVLLSHHDDAWEEAWGTVFLEAAAAGLPVVAGRSGGSDEAVQDLVTGLLVDVHQKKAVTQAILDLLNNPAYAQKIGAAGRARAEREFTWATQIKKIRDL